MPTEKAWRPIEHPSSAPGDFLRNYRPMFKTVFMVPRWMIEENYLGLGSGLFSVRDDSPSTLEVP